ncbi:MAG: response regulator [Smithellaceae bacterium]|nr:response regulator [Smithellaceae bacterium]
MTDTRGKILLIEDNPADARLIKEILKDAAQDMFKLEHFDRLSEGLKRLSEGGISVLLTDIGLPDSQGLETFRAAYAHAPEVPIVVLTGEKDETIGIRALQEGAQDYLMKNLMDGRLLARSLTFAIERQKLRNELKDALAKIKTLRGMIPICSGCKKIRDDRGYWEVVEVYVRDHSEAEFSHGLCPECVQRMYPEYLLPKGGG